VTVWRVARVEARKAVQQPSTFVLLAILVGYVALLVLTFASLLRSPSSSAVDAGALLKPLRADAVGFLVDIASGIALILLVVFAAQGIGQEFSRGTLRTLLTTRRVARRDVALGKLLFLALASLPVALLVALAGVAGAGVLSAASGERLLHEDAGAFALLVLRTWAGLGLWALITFGTTLSTRSLGVGLGLSLGGLVAGDVLRGLLAGLGTAGLWASRALPNTAINALSSRAPLAGGDWAWIVPNVLLYVVALNAYATWELQRLDVIAATK
jgi:ABC-type transport system involved in multi-copper enzyme maturation permease subunit